MRGNKCEPQSEIRFAIAIILLKIIDMQQQQMFSLFILYQRWVNEYMQILNVAFLRRRRNLRRTRVAPYTWIIPRPAESWFDIPYNDPISTGVLSAAIKGQQKHF